VQQLSMQVYWRMLCHVTILFSSIVLRSRWDLVCLVGCIKCFIDKGPSFCLSKTKSSETLSKNAG
jgi:hypothetical protein